MPKATRARKPLPGPPPGVDAAIHRMLLRTSPVYFASKVLRGPEQPPFNGRWIYGPAHIAWDQLFRLSRFAMLATRFGGKSMFASFAYPLFLAYWNIRSSFLGIGNTDENIREVLRRISTEIEENTYLDWMLPASAKGSVWHSHELKTSHGFQMLTRSLFASKRGIHTGTTICDDILTDEAEYSHDYRKKVENEYFSVISNIPGPGAQLGSVCTAFNEADLHLGSLANNKQYTFAIYPVLDAHGQSIWPEVLSLSHIEARRDEIGEFRFRKEMMCAPVGDELSMFPPSLFMAEPQEQKMFRLGMAADELIGLTFVLGVDLAISTSAGADYFVATVLGIDEQGNRWICEIERHKGIGHSKQLSVINTLCRLYRVEFGYIEANQYQRVIADELMDKTDLPVQPYTTTSKKHHLEHGLPALRILAENRKFRIPRGDERSVRLTSELMGELAATKLDKGKVKSVGGHDDMLHSLFFACEAAKKGQRLGMILSGGSGHDDKSEEDEAREARIMAMMGRLG